MTGKVAILKRAKQLFVDHPEYWGMCTCLKRAIAGAATYEIFTISDEEVTDMFPEFNREFLGAPKNRYSYGFWWVPDSVLGRAARIEAFDKLIRVYE